MSHVGVLALQGDYARHIAMLQSIGVDAREFRESEDISELVALVIPGGESTTIGMLMERRGLDTAIPAAIRAGLPVFGTCAGAILLARTIKGSQQYRIGELDITVERNAYGSQVDSFEAMIDIADTSCGFKATMEAVFIRAPVFSEPGPQVQVLASFNHRPILVRQGKLLAASFHPELSGNPAVHRYFMETMVDFMGTMVGTG